MAWMLSEENTVANEILLVKVVSEALEERKTQEWGYI